MNNNYKLSVENLSCVRDDRVLFESLEFSIQNGQALLIEGHNGSGKTSLLRILCGFHRAEEGVVHWCDTPVTRYSDEYYQNIAYVSHKNGLKDDLTTEENLALSRELMGVSTGDNEQVLLKIGLLEQADLLVRQLSAGQKRRLALSRLLVTPYPLWILDEPFTSLDKNSIGVFEKILQEHVNNGGLLILTAHHDVDLQGLEVKRINLSE